jgi:hypothetical protein
LLVSSLREQGLETPRFTLAPECWLRHEHIDYDQLVELADDTLDTSERELIDAHLNICQACQEDVRSFLAFREQVAPELGMSYPPVVTKLDRDTTSRWDAWRQVFWKPIYVAAVLVFLIGAVVGVGMLIKRRARNLQARQRTAPQITPIVTRNDINPVAPSPSPDLMQSPPGSPLIALNDSGRTITIDKSGNAAGLDDVPAQTREEVAKVLIAEKLDPPVNLRELGGQAAALRGSNEKPPFKLTYPLRTVIVSARPTLKWETASGASSYRVYINDQNGAEVAKSDELSPDRTSWSPAKPLKRGEIFTWTVVAVVDGKEIVSPGSSLPEIKFKVLSTKSLEQLNKLKTSRSHVALGVFYLREGMVNEAEHEFQILLSENPSSTIAKKLLRQVEALQGR